MLSVNLICDVCKKQKIVENIASDAMLNNSFLLKYPELDGFMFLELGTSCEEDTIIKKVVCSNTCKNLLLREKCHPSCFFFNKEKPTCEGILFECDNCDALVCAKHSSVMPFQTLCLNCEKKALVETVEAVQKRTLDYILKVKKAIALIKEQDKDQKITGKMIIEMLEQGIPIMFSEAGENTPLTIADIVDYYDAYEEEDLSKQDNKVISFFTWFCNL